jgi:hypothetical protein
MFNLNSFALPLGAALPPAGEVVGAFEKEKHNK